MRRAVSAPSPMRVALGLCRPHLVGAAVFSAFVNLLYIVPTLYMLQVYDRVVPTQGRATLVAITIALVVALAVLSLLDRVRTRLLARAGVAIDLALAPAILDAGLARPGNATARAAMREFDAMRQTLTGPAMLALFDAPWTPIYVLVCFLVHPWIGVLALVGVIILPLIAWRNEAATKQPIEEAQALGAETYAGQDAMLNAADTVRALGMRRAMVTRQIRLRESMMTRQTDVALAAGRYLSATKFVRLLMQSLALGLGALLAIDNQVSAGAIFAASFLIARALSPIEQLIGTWRQVVQMRGSYGIVGELIGDEAASAPPTQLPAPKGQIAVEGIAVLNTTRDAAILNGISFTARPGEVVAIVGPSGAGKSTLARVVAGAQAADRGVVRIDGAASGDWDADALARHIGYLPQDSTLFAGTVKENIARFMTELEADPARVDADVVAAARTVGAHDLILRLSDGYDHVLQMGGRGLSAGQAQRIALARAVFRAPPILILDEPNAHLDTDGDQALTHAIARAKAAGTTVLIVSHKLSIMPVVDTIMVIRDGKLEAMGPRDEILPKLAPAGPMRRVPPAAPPASPPDAAAANE